MFQGWFIRIQSAAGCALLGAALLGTTQSSRAQTVAFDLNGHPVTNLAGPDTQTVVLVFAATDCPISNRYIPEIESLRARWQGSGVRFWWVFPNPGDTAELTRKHEQEFSIETQALLDSRHDLVRLSHVAVTPEAAVFAVRNGRLREVYHGRIDDRYIAFGEERPQATQHELDAAIRAALDGSAAPTPSGGPVGCSIIPLQTK